LQTNLSVSTLFFTVFATSLVNGEQFKNFIINLLNFVVSKCRNLIMNKG